jgi:hypothetical protein
MSLEWSRRGKTGLRQPLSNRRLVDSRRVIRDGDIFACNVYVYLLYAFQLTERAADRIRASLTRNRWTMHL